MMNGLNFSLFSPEIPSGVGFTRHPRVIFVLRGGNPCGAEQRQAGEEVEERHQPQHRAKAAPDGDFTSAGRV
jgi:hypothetical protein